MDSGTLQNDLLELYNLLVDFNKTTLKAAIPKPISVKYIKDSRLLSFEQEGLQINTSIPIYYCLGLEDLEKPTLLLPKDYDQMMGSLQYAIMSGELIKPRTIISPENYGFDIYATNIRELWKGPDIIASVRFVSGVGKLFKFITKLKYGY